MEKEQKEINLLDYLQILVRWRRLIAGMILLFCILAAVLSYLITPSYRSSATLLPPEQRSSLSGFASLVQFQGVGIPEGLGLPQLSNSSDVFVEILRSHNVTTRLVERFNLITYYGVAHLQLAEDQLLSNAAIGANKNGIITIQVEAESPQLAADLANAFVEELDRFNRENAMTSAKNTRIFIENRLNQARQDLGAALTALQTFQETHQVISLPDQAKMMVETAADIDSRLRLLEFELSVKRSSLAPTHPDIQLTQLQISTLRKQLDRLKYSDPVSRENPMNENSDIAFDRIPGLQLQLGQLMMEAKIQTTIAELLFQQYEQAKVQEVRDTPTVRILDQAEPPVMRSYPRRKEMVLIAGVAGLFVSLLLIFILEYRQAMTYSSQNQEKMVDIGNMLKSDLSWFGRRSNRP